MSSGVELQTKLLFSSTKYRQIFNETTIVPEKAVCQICLSSDQTHEPLVRDCSCSGISGFVHISCVAKAAEIKSNENINNWSVCSEKWNLCSTCGELYQDKLAIDLLSQFVNYIEKKHPEDQFSINVINAHAQLLRAIADMYTRTSSIQCNRMGRQIAQGIISRIDEMKKCIPTNSSTLPLIRSRSLFDAFQTQYGAGGETRRLGRKILPKLKAKSYENVKRYKLSPIWDKSDCTVNVRTILIKGLNNGDSASSITKAIKDGFNQFNWEIFSFSSCPM